MTKQPSRYTQFSGLSLALTLMLAITAAIAAGIGAGPAAAEETTHSKEPIKIVALGDSLTAGYMLPPGAGFPEQLAKALGVKGHAVSITNAGVSGDTSSGGLARLDWAMTDETNLLILELGSNDALRGIEPALTRANLSEIITLAKAKGARVLIAGMLAPPNMGEDYAADFNPIFADLAREHETAIYPFFLDGVAANPALNLADGMHPTQEGVAIIVERMLPLIETMIETMIEAPVSETQTATPAIN
ncbi:MAG: arylesterase [Parvibaculum sp.]